MRVPVPALTFATDSLSDLDNSPVAPDGVVAKINNLLGMATFGVLAFTVLALIISGGLLVLSATGRGGEGLEKLVRTVSKIFIGAFLASSALSICTLLTGGF